MTKKGRKPILTETEAKEIVNSYVLKHSVSKEIQYIDLHKYCIELYQNQEIPKLPSESFWRKKDRAGRKLIDEVNTALSHKLEKHEKDNELQNLLILIDNKIQNKELKITLFNELKSKQSKVEQLEQELNIKEERDRKSTRLNSSHVAISYAVFCLKKKKATTIVLHSLTN